LAIFVFYPIAIFFLILDALRIKWGLPVAEWIGVFGIIYFLKSFATDFNDFLFIINTNGVNFVNAKPLQTAVPQ